MRGDCPNRMHDHLASSDSSSTSSDEEQKRKEKIDRKQRKEKEKEKLVQEVAQAALRAMPHQTTNLIKRVCRS
jgi:hypothetical protein